MLPVMAALCVCVIFDLIAWSITRRESLSAAEKTADYFTSAVESRLLSLQAYSYDISNSDRAAQLSMLQGKEADSYSTKMNAARLAGRIYDLCKANPMADDVLIYYPGIDRIVSRHSLLTTYQYFLIENLSLDTQPQAFTELFDSIFRQVSGRFHAFANPLSGEVECYYCRVTPNGRTADDCDRMMAIRVSSREVASMMQDTAQSMNLKYVALVSNGKMFAQSGIEQALAPAGEEELLRELSGSKYYIRESGVLDMRFYFLPNESGISRFLRTLLYIMAAGLLLAGVTGVFLALHNHFLSERYMRSILQQLGYNSEDASLDKAVAEYVEKTYQANRHNIEQLERQRVMVRFSFLREALRMDPFDEARYGNLSAAYNVTLENDVFVLFVVDNSGTEGLIDREEILQFICSGHFDPIYVLWTTMRHVEVFLCNYDLQEDSKYIITAFKKQLSDRFGKPVYGSGVELANPAACNSEFRRLYRVITGSPFVPYGGHYTSKPTLFRKFADSISSGDTKARQYLLGQVLSQFEGEEENNRNYAGRYALLYELYSLPALNDKVHLLDEMYRDMRIETWKRNLQEILPSEAGKEEEQAGETVAAKAEKIICEEYSNPQMSLSLLAEQLGVSQSYLSRSFKQEYGENISHYLRRVRIGHAKVLMQHGNDNLNTIALKVGYLSDMNFIRVFKKMENETPGTFRKHNS